MNVDKASLSGIVLALGGILAGLLLEGGNLGQILQPTAAMIVFGVILAPQASLIAFGTLGAGALVYRFGVRSRGAE